MGGAEVSSEHLRPDTHRLGRPILYMDAHVEVRAEKEYIDLEGHNNWGLPDELLAKY